MRYDTGNNKCSPLKHHLFFYTFHHSWAYLCYPFLTIKVPEFVPPKFMLRKGLKLHNTEMGINWTKIHFSTCLRKQTNSNVIYISYVFNLMVLISTNCLWVSWGLFCIETLISSILYQTCYSDWHWFLM